MNVQHVTRLLAIANNHLPSVEYRYERLIREVDSLESWKLNSNRILENVTKNIEHYSLCCQRISTNGSTISEKDETGGRCKTL
jgi:hypothetical protein